MTIRATTQSASHATPSTTATREEQPRRAWVLPAIVLTVFMASAARQAARPVSDYDTFWHLRLGNEIRRTRSLDAPTAAWSDLSQQDWVPTQWLTEVLASTVNSWWGLPGVVALFTASVLALAVMVHRLCRQVAGSTVSGFVTGLCVLAMAPSLSPRPHMVSYILLAVTLSAWLRTSEDLRPRWWLIAVTWFWAMAHGMWFIGPLLGVVVILGLWADRRLSAASFARLAIVPLASIVGAGLTPAGPELLKAPFAVAGVSAFITEWQAPSFRSIGPAVAIAMVAFVCLSWGRGVRPMPWVRIAIVLLATAWILLATRTVTLGALLIAPLVAEALQGMLKQARDPFTRREQVALTGSALVCLAVVAVLVPRTAQEPVGVPSELDATLASLPDETVILNNYELGGWLRYEHPHVEPVIDGMTEAYSVEYLANYGRAQAAGPGWPAIVAGYGAQYALLVEEAPLATALLGTTDWRRVSEAEGYVLLRAQPSN